MSEIDYGLKLIESYRIWAQWLVTLDFAAIAAVVFLYRFNKERIPANAKLVLLPFGISILAASMVVGNLTSVVDRFVAPIVVESSQETQQAPSQEPRKVRASVSIDRIKSMDVNTTIREWLGVPTPLWFISAVGGLAFTVGALLLALVTAFPRCLDWLWRPLGVEVDIDA